ncbi:MAG: protein-export chaperone SecB [Oscillospiraceae bacterium]|nr:protein-export chaperone SecB [Oscillospiraceae bacterium]
MPKQSFLQFEDYDVEEMFFKSSRDSQNLQEFEIRPDFQQEITKCSENRFSVRLTIDISSVDARPIPFELKVSLVGHFFICDDEDVPEDIRNHVIKKNTLTILFPFLRATVASLTATANIPSLILPVMNFAESVE